MYYERIEIEARLRRAVEENQRLRRELEATIRAARHPVVRRRSRRDPRLGFVPLASLSVATRQ